MKKIVIYILLSVITTILAVETAWAKEISHENWIAVGEEDTEESEGINYERPIIPKPTYLPGPSEGQQEGSKTLFGTKVLPRLSVMMIGTVGGLSLVFLVIAGVRFAVAYGDDEAVTSAKKQAMFSVLGFLLALLSYAIVTILTNVEFVEDTTERSVTTDTDE